MAATDRTSLAIATLSVVVLLGAASDAARADGRAAAGAYLYLDSDHLEVVHPYASLRVEADDDTTLTGSYDADVITAATIDVRTSASPRAFTEARHGIGLDVAHELSPTLRIGAGASGSFSPDTNSATASFRLAWEDDTRIHTLSLSGGGSFTGVGRVGDQAPAGLVGSGGLTAGWAAVLSNAAVLDVALAGELSLGYLESPYRFVSIYTRGAAEPWLAMPESLPDSRLRGAARVRLRVAPMDGLFLRGSYRFHTDDWGVLGHTVELGAVVNPVSALSLGIELRYLGQRASSFYQGRYETLPLIPTWAARDRELAATTTLSAGLRVELALPDIFDGESAVYARGEFIYTRLYDTWLLPERLAGVVGLGLTWTR